MQRSHMPFNQIQQLMFSHIGFFILPPSLTLHMHSFIYILHNTGWMSFIQNVWDFGHFRFGISPCIDFTGWAFLIRNSGTWNTPKSQRKLGAGDQTQAGPHALLSMCSIPSPWHFSFVFFISKYKLYKGVSLWYGHTCIQCTLVKFTPSVTFTHHSSPP
jgi:hypothetical protein